MRLLNHPVLCNYYLTYKCNAKCGFCDIWQQPSPYVTLENVTANLNDLKKMGVKVIDFTGGEPLLHRQLPEILSLAKDHGFITTVTTNGLLYPKKARALAGLIDMLHFSLDAYDREQHDSLRGVKCYDSVRQSIDIALELGERPDILFTAFAHNLDQVAPVYKNITSPNNLVLILNPAFDYHDVSTGQPFTAKALSELRAWGKKPLVYLNEAFIALLEDGGNRVDKPVCRAGSSTVVISPANELVAPCYHLQKEAFTLNNNLTEVYNRPATRQALAMEGRHPECAGCTINCYMQPSFAIEVNKYFWRALPSTLKYNRMKGTWKQLI